MISYSEARRDPESTGHEAGFDPVNPEASDGKVLVETRFLADSVRMDGESRHALRFFRTQFQKFLSLLHLNLFGFCFVFWVSNSELSFISQTSHWIPTIIFDQEGPSNDTQHRQFFCSCLRILSDHVGHYREKHFSFLYVSNVKKKLKTSHDSFLLSNQDTNFID